MTADVQPNLGATLKSRRQECGLTLKEIALRTRIRRTYLQALEENRFDALPGEVYAMGFLRIYAGCLDMAPHKLLLLYRQQVGVPAEAGAPLSGSQPSSPPHRRHWFAGPLPWVAVGALLTIAIALASQRETVFPRGSLPVQDQGASALTALARPAEAAAQTAPEEATAAADPAPLSAAPKAVVATAAALAAVSKPLSVDFPGEGLLRLESLGANRIEFRGDDRPSRQYDLTAPAVLSWKIKENGRLVIANPKEVRLWLDRQPLNLNGRQEVLLRSIRMADSARP